VEFVSSFSLLPCRIVIIDTHRTSWLNPNPNPPQNPNNSATLRQVEVRYNTFGQLNAARDNVLVVCHALTGNARLDTWWASMLGPGKAFDTDKYVGARGVCGGDGLSIDRSIDY
jgi:hypothetical protein